MHTAHRRILFLTGAALLAGMPAFAQSAGSGAVVARAGAGGMGGFAASENHREIPVAVARTLIAAHHPDVVNGSTEATLVTLVLDANNNYVSSAASKPVVIARNADGAVVAAAGGFSGGAAVASPVSTSGGALGQAPGTSINIGGIGPIDASTIQEVFVTTYPEGEIASQPVRVRFIILKGTR